MDDNPYASPTAAVRPQRGSAWVAQVGIVAALLVLQGLAECGAALLLLYLWKKSLLSVGAVLVVFALGALKVFAGTRNLQYRNRGLGVIALFTGLLSLLPCFCLPSALAIMVYGLVVYQHRNVKRAFAARQAETGIPR